MITTPEARKAHVDGRHPYHGYFKEFCSICAALVEDRMQGLIAEAHAICDEAIHRHITSEGKEVAAVVALFSGGNDSSVLTHLFRERATHAAHANTTVGVEATREHVRTTCREWGLPLLERTAPRAEDQYRALVLDRGFPGPGGHAKMFQRLKERALRQVRNELVGNPRKQRVVFLAGRRRDESARRTNIPDMEREGSIVWASPLVNWTNADMNAYRSTYAVKRNEVADLIHMSGECLCGAFAHDGEREEVSEWFPEAFDEIAELEELLRDREDIPHYRKHWGWGGDAEILKASRKPSKQGRLCSSCDARAEQITEVGIH